VTTASIILLVLAGLIVASVVLHRHKPATPEGGFSWRQPLFVAIGASVQLLLMVVYGTSLLILLISLVVPIVCLICAGFLLVAAVVAAVLKKLRQHLSWLLTLVAFLVVSAAIWKNPRTIRASFRWLAWSHQYKAQVLAQPAPTGELKHIEWDGWGGFGQDTTVFLVFDPTDSLSAAAQRHQPGKFNGLPCKVARVTRLERNWYSVQFYTNEYWGERNELDCSAPASK